uniref:DUF155 domain-containing protein n=1 Tax=Clastoptera arizonana TaxID=38151 RepID=A0A1B6C7S8_9HEMI
MIVKMYFLQLSHFHLCLGGADVLHVEAKYKVTEEPRQVFFFREGSVVFWNIPDIECLSILDFLHKFEIKSYDKSLVQLERDNMYYTYNKSIKRSCLQDGNISFSFNSETPPVQYYLDMYTFSNAIALSVKLGVWEAILDRYIDAMEFVTEDLKSGKHLRISRSEVLRKTGELFALRHSINLSSDLLDTPDFYWDHDELETLYLQFCNYFSIGRRTKVMNEKLNHCMELVDLLSSHLSDRHHVRLEWMIIILIMIEVGFEMLHYSQYFFPPN